MTEGKREVSEYSRDDRVIAVRDIGSGWSSSVPKKTRGVVVGVETHFFSRDTIKVMFDNGEIEDVSEEDIYPDPDA